jgi:hypothetical protein
MSHRAEQLCVSAQNQITELIDLLLVADDTTMHLPCPGREKLGDGTVGAIAAHTAENYERIAAFVAAGGSMASRHGHGQPRRRGSRVLLRVLGHSPPEHVQAGPSGHQDGFTADGADPRQIVNRLLATRDDFARIGQLTDQQLDSVPPKDSFRFCDGERTLEQVLTGLLKHQDHQLQALVAALSPTP